MRRALAVHMLRGDVAFTEKPGAQNVVYTTFYYIYIIHTHKHTHTHSHTQKHTHTPKHTHTHTYTHTHTHTRTQARVMRPSPKSLVPTLLRVDFITDVPVSKFTSV
jgi:ABC-type Zn2+ transport system substrate-binding protein/surface adhesin